MKAQPINAASEQLSHIRKLHPQCLKTVQELNNPTVLAVNRPTVPELNKPTVQAVNSLLTDKIVRLHQTDRTSADKQTAPHNLLSISFSPSVSKTRDFFLAQYLIPLFAHVLNAPSEIFSQKAHHMIQGMKKLLRF